MKAIVINGYGEPNVLTEQEVVIPTLKENEVLIEMYATSINPVDSNIRAGIVQDVFPVDEFPHILGLDVAGIIIDIGENVTQFERGDRVFGLAKGNSGSYAEYAIAEQALLAKIPPTVSFNEAAGLPAVSLTAWHTLFQYGKLQQGERILIHAGAGGVGHIAIQMAKLAGAYIITTASSRNHDFVKNLGADEIIDYNVVDFSETVKDVDIVFDAVVGLNQEKNIKVLKDGGRVVSIVTPNISDIAKEYNVDAQFVIVQPSRRELKQIADWVEDNKIKLHINRIFPFTEICVREAHNLIETKHTNGKLVVQIRS
ncbi:NADP-dependent oxidoreductase [Metabacillus malikii]|uniref:NADPH:quinone reductase-like Zn-dependent oxidoreductase n=1 Tax=Metabacillus malikii TaxID=1504265 RepID=A0ABT9ZEM1_9BACI|nr:NADP-dependent oxidoreductase [Metabacillus malikii]MDQ0230701.1 NADPH:quinone reductase-like Zn-dependent oxidoreductase [Metabacillus malikii]